MSTCDNTKKIIQDQILDSFDQIYATTSLKENTKKYILEKRPARNFVWMIPAVACLFLIFICARWIYFVPVTTLSIDINPSIEFEVNRCGQVLHANACNDDGSALLQSMESLKYKKYDEALEMILKQEKIQKLIKNNEHISVGVICDSDQQREKMLNCIKEATKNLPNAHCFSAHLEDVAEAHAHGLSYGKYKVYLELLEKYPEITIEEVQNMTMKEMYDHCTDNHNVENHETQNHNAGSHETQNHNEGNHETENHNTGTHNTTNHQTETHNTTTNHQTETHNTTTNHQTETHNTTTNHQTETHNTTTNHHSKKSHH